MWQAVITSKRGRKLGTFDINDVRGYVASMDQAFTKLGPRVWMDADGNRTVLEHKALAG